MINLRLSLATMFDNFILNFQQIIQTLPATLPVTGINLNYKDQYWSVYLLVFSIVLIRWVSGFMIYWQRMLNRHPISTLVFTVRCKCQIRMLKFENITCMDRRVRVRSRQWTKSWRSYWWRWGDYCTVVSINSHWPAASIQSKIQMTRISRGSMG